MRHTSDKILGTVSKPRSEVLKQCLGLTLFFRMILLANTASAESGLEAAYVEEISVLRMEKAAIEKQIQKLEEASAATLDTLRGKVSELSAELTELRIENDQEEEALARNRDLEVQVAEGNAFVDNFRSLSKATLEALSITRNDAAATPEAEIEQTFIAATRKIGATSGIRVEEGAFYDREGKQRTSDILWMSRVSATSLDKTHGGMLAPAAHDALKVMKAADPRLLTYADGRGAAIVEAILFDPLEKNPTGERIDKDLLQQFQSGGVIMWPILLLGIVSLFILFERHLVLRRIHTNADRLMNGVGAAIETCSWDKARALCSHNKGAVAQVLHVILNNRTRSRDQQEELVYESILAQKPKMERFLSVLNIIAAVAPLLGLLGTVTGMIGTFEVITVHGTGDPRMLSGGISEALLTTQLGLVVAIPSLFFHAILSSRVDHIVGDMETNALRLLNILHCTDDKTHARKAG